MMKKLAYIYLFILPFVSFGQKPFINSISPTNIEVGQTVTISGSNLGGASTKVFFGGVESSTVTGSGNVLEATVPAGVTSGPITVLNTTSNLIGQSSEHFYISFSGSTSTTFDTEFLEVSGETDANDICLCDLDGDGLNDVVISHSVNDNAKSEISIYRNTSTASTISFNKLANINNSDNQSGFIANTCADLDNDGLPDLIFTTNLGTNSRHVYIYRNTSTSGTISISDLSSIVLRLPSASGSNRLPRRIKAADIDGDGKKDLVVGNDTDNTFHVFRNTSTPGSFSFVTTPTEISSGNDVSGNIFIVDINSDGRPDVISSPFRAQSLQTTSSVTIFVNNSIEGSFSFSEETSISNGTDRISDLSSGDFDLDGLNDVVVVSRDGGNVKVYRNSSSGGTISFETAVDAGVTGTPFGVDLGDINGDGKIDVITTSAAGNVTIVPNNSTSGTLSFSAVNQITTTNTTQYVCVGDLNADAKPDIAFTHDISSNGPIGNLGVFINRNCIVPIISPLGLNFCTGTSFRLFATNALDATYNWTITAGTGTSPGNTGSNNFADFTIPSGSSVTIQVQVTQSNTVCSTPTASEVFTLNASVTTDPVINVSPAGILCVGDAVTLSSSTTNNSYLWTLPNGSTLTTSTVTLSSVNVEDAGNYMLRVQNDGSCASSEVTTVTPLEVAQPPSLGVVNNGNDTFCDDAANDPQLQISSVAGLSYQWKRDGTNITGETGTTYTATQSGNYSVVVTDGNPCSNETTAYTVTEFTEPVASLAGPTETCVSVATTFSSTSTVQTGSTPVNSWVVEDASNTVINTFSGDDLVFTFPTVGTYEVLLTTSYDPTVVTACSDLVTQMVTVSAVPTVTFSVAEGAEKCQTDALTVGVSSPVSASISAYQWSINGVLSTGTTADVTTLTRVDSVYAVVTITTTIGCTVTDSVKVKNFPTNADISSTQLDPATSAFYDLSSDTVTLADDSFISLTAENLVSNIAWSPASIINDSTASTVTVFPANSPTTITVSGTDANGCGVTSSVVIILDNVRPRRTFSPNGDGLGFDCWEILNTSNLTGCKVYVFDSRGKNIVVADSPFVDNCAWDGNYNGTPVPEGLYYFVLKCDDSSLTKSGSILLAR